MAPESDGERSSSGDDDYFEQQRAAIKRGKGKPQKKEVDPGETAFRKQAEAERQAQLEIIQRRKAEAAKKGKK